MATAAASKMAPRQEEGRAGERRQSYRYTGKERRAMSTRREQVREALSPPERGHAPELPSGRVSKPTGNHPAPLLCNSTSPAPQLGPVLSQAELSPGAPIPPQPSRRDLSSPVATKLEPPPTPTLPLEPSRVPVGEILLSLLETTSPPPELWSFFVNGHAVESRN